MEEEANPFPWKISVQDVPLQLQCENMDQDGTQEFRPDPARKLSTNLFDIYHCFVYSEKLLMMDRGTVRNM